MDTTTYIKRLQTIQNMTDTTGVKELCELMMDYLEDTTTTPVGFNAKPKQEHKHARVQDK